MEKGMQRVMLGILSFMVGAIALCLVFAIQKYNIELQSRLNGYLLPILVGGVWGLIFGFWGWQLKQGKEQNQRLNLILDAIRNVSHLLVHEKDRTKLLNAICENLVKNRGYHNAWLAVFDESGGLPTISQKGLEKDLLPIAEGIRDGRMINCIKKASVKSGVVITGNPSSACPDCPLSQNYINRGAMTVRLEYGQKVYGILTVSTAKDFIGDLFEHELFEEIAGDIGYALNSLELEEKNARLQIEQQKIIQERGERIKELNCLFGISRLIEKRRSQLEEIIQGIVDLIPPALQYPQIACARITLDEQEFKTDRFEETVWRQEFDITVKDNRRGKVEVFYREKIPQFNEGPFLNEEKNLIDAVAERLGKIIERGEAEAALRESEKRFRDLVENSLTGISIIQNDQIVYQNQEQERLLGPLPRSSVLGDFEYIHPDDVEEVKRLNQGIVSGDIRSLDIEFRLLPQNGTSGNRDIKWIYCRTISTEYRGKESILVNMIDMTKIKELEHLLVIQDKMASLGRVAAGIAHEIRNPLSGINIYLNTLEKIYDRPDSQPKVEQIFGQLKSASKKIESVIRRVMDFAKPGEPKFALTQINQPIEEAIKLTAVFMRKSGIKVEKDLAEDLPFCFADPNLIEETVLNLLNNAAESMKNMEAGKKIAISSKLENDRIYVKVSDSGPGVPLDIRQNVFDPFYTTKNGGTGIGLSICHRIISDHKGALTVLDSEMGGAEFRIELPVKNDAA